MLRYIITFVLLVSIGYSTVAQQQALRGRFQTELIETGFNSVEEIDLRDVIGSPYANNDFQKGIIIMRDTLYIRNIPLRYNIFSDEIEIEYEKNDIKTLAKTDRVVVYIDRKKYIYNESIKGYFEVLHEDDRKSLYKKSTSNFIPERENSTSYSTRGAAQFRNDHSYYLYDNENGSISELQLKRRAFFNSFKDKKDEVSDFVNNKRLNINQENDLIKIVEFYNTLYN